MDRIRALWGRIVRDPPPAAGIVLLLLLSVGLRAWGLGWGLPHPGRYYPFHPDETSLLYAVCNVSPLWLDFTPGFYNYGSLYILLSRVAYDFAASAQGWGTVPGAGPFGRWVGDLAHLLLVSRWVAVALGAGTVLTLVALGRTLYSERTGWLAALFLSVAPLPVMLGHYMAVDVPAAFFTTVALLLAGCALRSPDAWGTARWVMAAGFAAGLAIGTKYSAVPVAAAVILPVAPLWLSRRKGARSAVIAAGLGAAALGAAGFLLATPGCLLEPKLFTKHVMEELGRSGTGQGLIFVATPPAVLYHLGISLPVGLEWPLYLLAWAGIGWAFYRHRWEDVLLLAFILLTLGMVSGAERKFLRYATGLMPPLVLLAARVVDEGLSGRLSGLWKGWAALAGGAALASTVAHLGVISAPDAREQAAAYLRANARPADVVALGSDPWFYTPPVDPTAGCVKVGALLGGPPRWDDEPDGSSRPALFPLPEFQLLAPASMPPAGALPVSHLARYRPRYVVLTDYEYEDPERIRRSDATFPSGILDLLAALGRDYHLEKELRPRPSVAGFEWWRRGIPPHDWRYYMPTVQIYEQNPE